MPVAHRIHLPEKIGERYHLGVVKFVSKIRYIGWLKRFTTNFFRAIATQNISKVKITLTRLTSSSAHPEPGYEGTPTDYCKDQAVFDAGAVPFLFVS